MGRKFKFDSDDWLTLWFFLFLVAAVAFAYWGKV